MNKTTNWTRIVRKLEKLVMVNESICHIFYSILDKQSYNLKNRGRIKGTNIVKTKPLNIDIAAYSSPELLTTEGNVVSIDVAPPETIGASLPNILTKIGEKIIVNDSLKMLEINANKPSVYP